MTNLQNQNAETATTIQQNVQPATTVANQVNQTTQEKGKKSKNGETKKRKPVSIMARILRKAKKVFNAQILKSNETKLLCVETFINLAIMDAEKFWSDFMEWPNELLNSKRYEKECKELDVGAKILATHIAFLGKSTVNKVIKNGIVPVIGGDYLLYTERFVPESAEKYIVDNN